MENEEFIQNYIHNKLSAQDRKTFEERLLVDPALNEEFETHQNLRQAIKENERIELKRYVQDIELSAPLEIINDDEETLTFARKYRHIYAAAAVIIFAIVIFQFLEKEPNSQDLYASFYEPYPNTLQPIVRGEMDEDVLSLAFLAYESAQYDKAVTLFERSLNQSYDANISFYKAMSLLNSGKQEQALKIINSLKNEQSNYKPQLYWYSALIALESDKEETALERLDSLTSLKSGFKERAIVKIKKQLAE